MFVSDREKFNQKAREHTRLHATQSKHAELYGNSQFHVEIFKVLKRNNMPNFNEYQLICLPFKEKKSSLKPKQHSYCNHIP